MRRRQETQGKRPVQPRDAASLVLLRAGGGAHQVLLGKRASGHRFMPDVFVFPGGRLDVQDRGTQVLRDLRPDVAGKLQAKWTAGKARALAVAAVRETYEETGLLIGEHTDGCVKPDLSQLEYVARAITPTNNRMRFHARFFCVDAAHAGGSLRESHELVDLRWVALEEAFRLPIVDVTEFVLSEVRRRLQGWTPPGIPLFSYRHGSPRIVYQ